MKKAKLNKDGELTYVTEKLNGVKVVSNKITSGTEIYGHDGKPIPGIVDLSLNISSKDELNSVIIRRILFEEEEKWYDISTNRRFRYK